MIVGAGNLGRRLIGKRIAANKRREQPPLVAGSIGATDPVVDGMADLLQHDSRDGGRGRPRSEPVAVDINPFEAIDCSWSEGRGIPLKVDR